MNFDWDKMSANLQADALTEGNKKTYTVDERFYKLSRDDQDNGGALIRFVPDADSLPFIKMTKINARQNDGSKRFVAEWSPQTLGKPDPFNERFLELWNKDEKEEAKKYSRAFRYITNIVIVKDPKNPENDGKTFLFDMSPTLFSKVKDAMTPTESELALGAEAKAVFNPIEGNNFLLKVAKANTGFLSYETSKFDEKITSLYKDEKVATKAITENTYSLGDFLKPESFMTYDELVDKMAWFDGGTLGNAQDKETEEAVKEVEKAAEVVNKAEAKPEPKESKEEDLDELLDSL